MKNLVRLALAFVIVGICCVFPAASVKAETESHLEKLMSKTVFEQMFPNRNYYLQDAARKGKWYKYYLNITVDPKNWKVTYNTPGVDVEFPVVTYEGLIEAAKNYPKFCDNESVETDKRELAAFLANASHETFVGWGSFEPDSERFTYGLGVTVENVAMYDDVKDKDLPDYRKGHPKPEYVDVNDKVYPPTSGISYHGRGALQLSHNANYGMFGKDKTGKKETFLNNPDIIGYEPVLFWESAIWFWMFREQPDTAELWTKPSCHAAMTDYKPDPAQTTKYGIRPGFGLTIICINGGIESRKNLMLLKDKLSKATTAEDIKALKESIERVENQVKNRIGFYKRYCKMLGVDPGPEDTLNALEMDPFPQAK
jgi:hypothetical protein